MLLPADGCPCRQMDGQGYWGEALGRFNSEVRQRDAEDALIAGWEWGASSVRQKNSSSACCIRDWMDAVLVPLLLPAPNLG